MVNDAGALTNAERTILLEINIGHERTGLFNLTVDVVRTFANVTEHSDLDIKNRVTFFRHELTIYDRHLNDLEVDLASINPVEDQRAFDGLTYQLRQLRLLSMKAKQEITSLEHHNHGAAA